MEIYDIIHGSIEIEPLAKKIIDTKEFQRLRNIKQLGCCNYVFPGTLHTRFEHSIGVYHLAKKYIDILIQKGANFSSREIDCITIAALIHDIGHGPYSHLFDELFDESKNHEYRSGQLLKLMNQKYNLGFNEKEIQTIIDYIYPNNIEIEDGKKYLYQIVSNKNGIDVDRFDYLMRDIHMTGLNYGIEYERIMQNSKIENGEIIYSEKVKTNIQEFFHVRMIMYKEVYNHRTVRGIEYMMKDFIKEFDASYNITEMIETDDWDKFIQFNDSIIYFFKETYDKHELKMKEIIESILSRKIYKSVGEIYIDEKVTDINLEYDKENIIVDLVNLSKSKEECKFYQEKNRINTTTSRPENEHNTLIRIYIKDEKYKGDAQKLFSIVSYQFSPSSS